MPVVLGTAFLGNYDEINSDIISHTIRTENTRKHHTSKIIGESTHAYAERKIGYNNKTINEQFY
jgi:hypothetical protein